MAKPTRYTQEMIDDYTSKGYWGTVTTSELWDRNAMLYPHKEAIVDSNNRVTWADVKRLSDRLSLRLLEMGFKKDDLIVMQLPNCVDSYVVRLGCEKAGVLCGTALTTLRHRELEYILRNLDAMGVVIPGDFRRFDYFRMIVEIRPNLPSLRHVFCSGEKVPSGTISLNGIYQEPLEERYPSSCFEKTRFGVNEVAIVALTSGTTTGMPKFAEHPICARMAYADGLRQAGKLTGDDIVLIGANIVAGLGAAFGYTGSTPLAVAKCVVMERWDEEEALSLIEREKATVFAALTTQVIELIRHPNLYKYDLSSLRYVHGAGAFITPEVVAEIEQNLGAPFVQTLGSMDCGGFTTLTLDDPPQVRYRTVGKPFPGCEIRLVDEKRKDVPQGNPGELLVRGPATVSGYYKNLEATLEAWGTLGKEGWFRTGDLGVFDKHGNLILVGRKKDIIKRHGQNIFPEEIEAILAKHPKVGHVAIVGMPDSMTGEKACAYVEPKPGERFTFEEMISFLKEQRIASFKLPERLEIREKLPVAGAADRVIKQPLREDIVQILKTEGKI